MPAAFPFFSLRIVLAIYLQGVWWVISDTWEAMAAAAASSITRNPRAGGLLGSVQKCSVHLASLAGLSRRSAPSRPTR